MDRDFDIGYAKMIGEKRGKEKEKLEIAKNMKIGGLSNKEIALYTGLTISEIEKL